MKIRVKLLKPFSNMVGKGEVNVEMEPGATVTDLVGELASKFPKFREGAYEKDGSITDYITMFVNDKPVSALDGMETKLEDGNEVLIFMPVSGG